MLHLKAIFLDFDGVICESCQIKNQAYYNSYIEYGKDYAQQALDYHLLHGGVSRVKVFEILHKKFFGKEISNEEHKKMCERFTSWVEQKVIEAPLTKGVEEFLEKYYKITPIFVSSGTPQDEMRRIVENKGLSKYFKEVLGSPSTKDIHINNMLTKYKINGKESIFVGDATTDRDAAQKTGVNFIARLSEDSILQSEKYTIVDFTEIDNIINKI